MKNTHDNVGNSWEGVGKKSRLLELTLTRGKGGEWKKLWAVETDREKSQKKTKKGVKD